MTRLDSQPALPAPPPGNDAPFNPFVPIARWAVLSMVTLGGLYTLLVCSVALFNAIDGGISMVCVALSSAWLIFWTFYPFLFYKPEYGWCHPLILGSLVSIANLMLRSTALFMNGLNEHIMLPDYWPEQLNLTFAYGNFVLSLAPIAIYLGFACGPRLPVPGWHAPATASMRLYVVLLFFLGLSLTAFALYVQVSGGLSSCLKNMAFGMTKKIGLVEDVDGLGQYTVAIKMATVVAVVWTCAQASAFRNPAFWILTVTALVLAYLSEGKRSSMLYPVILIFLCWTLRNRQVPYFRVAVFAVLAFLIFGLLAMFRSSNWSDTQHLNLSALENISISEIAGKSQDEFIHRSGTGATFYPILVKVPSEEKLLWGRTYLDWGLRFIPRELWPDKPRGVDVQANETFYGGDWGMPPGAVGEAYWNFHLPGVIIIFFLFGMFKRWFVDLLLRHPDAPAIMAIYMLSIFYFDASENGFRAWLYAILPVLPMLWMGGLLHQKQTSARRVRVGLPRPSHAS